MTAERAISRFRRDITLGALLRGAMLAAAVGALSLNAVSIGGKHVDGTMLLLGLSVLWMYLSFRSVRGSRLAAESPSLIAAGQFDAAEKQIEQALSSFSLFRGTKVLSLHHLALLRHAQGQWRESAMLSRVLLGQRLGTLQSVSRPARLLLADSLLEMNDLAGAHAALTSLYQERLSLAEAINLLLVQLEYESRIGAWQSMLPRGSIYRRVQLIELMPAPSAAKAHALMALAAKRLGREDWAHWLGRRAELLADRAELVRERPALSELWDSPESQGSPAAPPRDT